MGSQLTKDILKETPTSEIKKRMSQYANEINEKDIYGWTALHHAIQLNRFDLAQLLVQHGADMNISNMVGQTPLDLAQISNRGHLLTHIPLASPTRKSEERISVL